MIALQNMRMSCNSTYLLDQETDFGVKVDELATLLGDVFEEKDAKVVIFSQWTRTHELIERRLQANGWGYVFLHGGVPGSQRKDLIHAFKNDPECRVFLSTDAGGVGLNLQNASMVVNMDLPWNPAVLEQRIGRVHRLGQRRPVRVVNFIAQGTIEHGMLSLLSFKKSLFAGVLDGGQDEVFLGQSRMKRFMESVEKVSESIPEAMPLQPGEVEIAAERRRDEAEPEAVETGAPTGVAATATAIAANAAATGAAETTDSNQAGAAAFVGGSSGDPTLAGERSQQVWSDLLTAGMSFLEKLGQSMNVAGFEKSAGGTRRADGTVGEGGLGAAGGGNSDSPFVARDEKTGEPYLRIPMPPPETLRKVADLLGGFLR
jgi:superfamily II DNA/RNA helicase